VNGEIQKKPLTETRQWVVFYIRRLARGQVTSLLFIQWNYSIERSDSMTLEELRALRVIDPAKEARVDIAGIHSLTTDPDAPAVVRARQYLEQVKNPYAFKCGDIAVNVEFSPRGKTLREAMVFYLSAQRK
jgi:hypothetical protein